MNEKQKLEIENIKNQHQMEINVKKRVLQRYFL